MTTHEGVRIFSFTFYKYISYYIFYLIYILILSFKIFKNLNFKELSLIVIENFYFSVRNSVRKTTAQKLRKIFKCYLNAINAKSIDFKPFTLL